MKRKIRRMLKKLKEKSELLKLWFVEKWESVCFSLGYVLKLIAAALLIPLLFGVILFVFLLALETNWSKNDQSSQINRYSKYVVQMLRSQESHMGTGFYVKAPSGTVYILTNKHICEGSKTDFVLVKDMWSNRALPRRKIEVFAKHDLCLLEALPGRDGLEVADSIELWESVTAVGYPVTNALDITSGIVKQYLTISVYIGPAKSAQECKDRGYDYEEVNLGFFMLQSCVSKTTSYMTNARIFGGNSGSPALNRSGEVIGVMFASSSDTNWGFMVPLHEIKSFLAPY